MLNRRRFLEMAGLASGYSALANLPTKVLERAGLDKLTILHTNDVHSHMVPFKSGRNAGLGGAARRASLVKQIRAKESNVLLLDAGDMFQGTPYFNFYGGEIEFKAMSAMKYDAATIGNHDFDGGIDGLSAQMKHANFPLLSANYNFEDTVLAGRTKPYQIFKKGALKVGVIGLGIELSGLVPKTLTKETRYEDPLAAANKYANILRHDEKCDLVICLSHLGYKYDRDIVSDRVLAEQSSDIDIILGGHTHTFMKEPEVILNAKNQKMLINQVGWAGINLGRIDLYFEKGKKLERLVEGAPVLVK